MTCMWHVAKGERHRRKKEKSNSNWKRWYMKNVSPLMKQIGIKKSKVDNSVVVGIWHYKLQTTRVIDSCISEADVRPSADDGNFCLCCLLTADMKSINLCSYLEYWKIACECPEENRGRGSNCKLSHASGVCNRKRSAVIMYINLHSDSRD